MWENLLHQSMNFIAPIWTPIFTSFIYIRPILIYHIIIKQNFKKLSHFQISVIWGRQIWTAVALLSQYVNLDLTSTHTSQCVYPMIMVDAGMLVKSLFGHIGLFRGRVGVMTSWWAYIYALPWRADILSQRGMLWDLTKAWMNMSQ